MQELCAKMWEHSMLGEISLKTTVCVESGQVTCGQIMKHPSPMQMSFYYLLLCRVDYIWVMLRVDVMS